MKLALKVLGIAVVLALVVLAAFALWGESFAQWFGREGCTKWFSETRSVAWLAGIGLLLADLILPIPATGVMAALGAIYGIWLGAALGVVGSASAGLIGHGLARLAGRKGMRLIADDEEVDRFRAFFDRWGGVGVIVSRALPILPEVVAVLAGLARMSFARFAAALLLGTVPVCVLFAWVGSASAEEPSYGIGIAVAVPLLLWPFFLRAAGRS